jgi:hypothetical protein
VSGREPRRSCLRWTGASRHDPKGYRGRAGACRRPLGPPLRLPGKGAKPRLTPGPFRGRTFANRPWSIPLTYVRCDRFTWVRPGSAGHGPHSRSPPELKVGGSSPPGCTMNSWGIRSRLDAFGLNRRLIRVWREIGSLIRPAFGIRGHGLRQAIYRIGFSSRRVMSGSLLCRIAARPPFVKR